MANKEIKDEELEKVTGGFTPIKEEFDEDFSYRVIEVEGNQIYQNPFSNKDIFTEEMDSEELKVKEVVKNQSLRSSLISVPASIFKGKRFKKKRKGIKATNKQLF